MTTVKDISKAMLSVGSLAADKKNTHDNYDYISSDKVLEKIGKTLGNLGVVVIPGVTNCEIKKEDRSGGKVMYVASLSMQMTIRGSDGEATVPWFGCGVDYRVPDKAVYKAITSGHSYFLRKLLMVGVGNEDGEHEAPEGEPEPAPERPYPAEYTKERLLKAAKGYEGKPISDKQAKAFIIAYSGLFFEDESRYAVTKWIFGKASTSDLTPAQKLALIKWMDWEEVDGKMLPSRDAIAEAQVMLRYVEGL